MSVDCGKVKTVEVVRACDINGTSVEVCCQVECVQDIPEDSEILSAVTTTDDETNVFGILVWSDKSEIFSQAFETVDWDTPE